MASLRSRACATARSRQASGISGHSERRRPAFCRKLTRAVTQKCKAAWAQNFPSEAAVIFHDSRYSHWFNVEALLPANRFVGWIAAISTEVFRLFAKLGAARKIKAKKREIRLDTRGNAPYLSVSLRCPSPSLFRPPRFPNARGARAKQRYFLIMRELQGG